MTDYRKIIVPLGLTLVALFLLAYGPLVASAQQVPPAASREVKISAGVAMGNLIQKTPPTYPPIAIAARISGTVVLQAIISRAGTIENLNVISGPALLQQAAMDAVKTWRYKPYLLNDEPVEVETTVNVIFTLAGSGQSSSAAAESDATPPGQQGSVAQQTGESAQSDQNVDQDADSTAAQSSDFDNRVATAVALVKAGRLTEAESVAAALVKSDPNRWEGYGLEGSIDESENKMTAAKAAYQHALNLAPADVSPQLQEKLRNIEMQTKQ